MTIKRVKKNRKRGPEKPKPTTIQRLKARCRKYGMTVEPSDEVGLVRVMKPGRKYAVYNASPDILLKLIPPKRD